MKPCAYDTILEAYSACKDNGRSLLIIANSDPRESLEEERVNGGTESLTSLEFQHRATVGTSGWVCFMAGVLDYGKIRLESASELSVCSTFLMSSRKASLFPLNLTPCGPGRSLLASSLSSFSEDRHLAKTASPDTHTHTHQHYSGTANYVS